LKLESEHDESFSRIEKDEHIAHGKHDKNDESDKHITLAKLKNQKKKGKKQKTDKGRSPKKTEQTELDKYQALMFDDDLVAALESGRPKPYSNGDYEYSVEDSRYRPVAQKYAEQIRRAIPYASGKESKNHIITKTNVKHAKPLEKKIIDKKAIKASSLPITKQCPKCGTFKVRTFKSGINKCLECKIKF
jgi:hypothetical protein